MKRGSMLLAVVAAGILLFFGTREGTSLRAAPQGDTSYVELISSVQSKPVPAEGFSFVVIGDSRSNFETAGEIFGRAGIERPAFVLHTGDLVGRGRRDEYLEYHFPLARRVAPVPVIPAAGNHEEGPGESFSVFKSFFGGDRYNFDYGDSRFVCVNNGDSDRLGPDDLQYLEQELSKPGVKHKFVIAHVPPVFVESGDMKDDGSKYRGFTKNADAFHALMVRQKVEDVFLGHDHGYLTRTFDGVRYTISAGGGADLKASTDWMQLFYHYMVVHVTPEGVRREIVRKDESGWVRSTVE